MTDNSKMANDLERFLAESEIAADVRLTGRVVVRRTTLSAREIEGLESTGRYIPDGEESCELVFGGVVIARGAIVEREGGRYFIAESAGTEREPERSGGEEA